MGTFAHVEIGHDFAPNIHPCIMFELAGDHLGRLLRHFRKEYDEGLPLITVKKFMRDILIGLDYLHKCNVIHTDIKPSNLLMNRRVNDVSNLDDLRLAIGDLGSSTPADELFSQHVGTDGYIAPELILELQYTSAIDIWSAFVVCYSMITGEHLFDVYNEDDVDYGDDIREDLQSPKPDILMTWDNSGSNEDPDMVGGGTSDSSGDESVSEHTVNYKTLLLVEKVLGPAPKEFTQQGREYYNARGKLKNNPDVQHMSISGLLRANYDMDEKDCREVEDFLLCGLRYLPETRCTAEQALNHPFLQI
jgi:serine/threonine protein kinase